MIEGTRSSIPAGDRLGASEEQEHGVVGRCYDQFRGVVEERPGTSLTTAFLAGLGVGAAIGWLLAEPARAPSRWYEHGAETAERVGRKVLDAVQGILPASLKS
jgi:hypothetical protein